MSTRPSEITGAKYLSFDDDLRFRSLAELSPGAARFIQTGRLSDLPMNNGDACVEFMKEQAQINYSLRSAILDIRADATANGFQQKCAFDYGDLDAPDKLFLPFTAAGISPALTRFPKDEDDYDCWKNGEPCVPTYDATLIPGSGLMFAIAWTANDTGRLFLRSAGQRKATQVRWFKGSQFEGAGNMIANLATIGNDIFGKPISPMPSSTAQLTITLGLLLTETLDYTTDFSDPAAPVITFVAPVNDDQTVQFRIEAV